MADTYEGLAAGSEAKALRGCDGCTLCCKLMGIQSLAKPRNVWCSHCKAGVGCRIYDDRPDDCRSFHCGYLVMDGMTPEWKPAVSHLILTTISNDRLNIVVDPSWPDAWRRQPYYGQIKEWARQGMRERRQVVVLIGNRVVVALPEHDTDFGLLAADETIMISERPKIGGMEYEAFAVKRNSELGAAIEASPGKLVSPAQVPGAVVRPGRRLGAP